MADEERARALALARAHQLRARALSSRGPALASGAPEGYELVGRFNDGGRVLRDASGALQAVSAGGSTTDPETVARIMAGDSFSAVLQDSVDQQRIAENPVAARTNEVVRGVPFVGSYADEAVGVVSPQARDNMRATTQAMQRQHPGQTTALNMAGAVAGSIPMAMAAAPSVLSAAPASRLGQAALAAAGGASVGAAEGAIYGAGEGQSPQEREQAARRSAAVGAATGGSLGLASPFVGAGLRSALERVQGSDVGAIATALGVSRPAAAIVRDAMDSGGIDGAIDRIQRGGEGAMVADAGKASDVLLDAAAQAGGRPAQIASDAMEARTNESAERITQALDEILGAPRGERELIAEIRSSSAPARQQAYNAAYAAQIDYGSEAGRRIERLLPRVPDAAWRRTEQLMALDDLPMPDRPDVRTIDYLTRALNDVAAEADGKGALGGQTNLGRATAGLSRSIRQSLGEAVPEYRAALDVASDAISQRNSVDLGYDLLTARVRREDVAEAMEGASRAERQAVAQGIRSYADEAMGRVQRTMTDPNTDTREAVQALRMFSSRSNQEKLRMALGRRNANRLMEQMDEAATAFELRAAISANSRTAVRLGVQSGVNDAAEGGMVRTLARGEPVNAAKRLTQALTGETAEAQELRRMGLYEEIVTAMTAVRGAEAERAVRLISGAIDRQEQLSARQARIVADALLGSGLTASRGADQARRQLAR